MTLTTSTDPFFQGHHLATFGDLGTSLKSYVQSYQTRSLAQSPSAINSISDMKKFVEEYPEFRKLGGNVSKHVALVGELSRLVEKNKLLVIGETEQGLATSSGADLKVNTKQPCHLLSWSCLLISTNRPSRISSGTARYLRSPSCELSFFSHCDIRRRKRTTLLISSP